MVQERKEGMPGTGARNIHLVINRYLFDDHVVQARCWAQGYCSKQKAIGPALLEGNAKERERQPRVRARRIASCFQKLEPHPRGDMGGH